MTPIRAQALHLELDTEDIPSKTPGTNPIKMLPTSCIQEKHQKGSVTIHNTQR